MFISFFYLRKNPLQTADPYDVELYAIGIRSLSIWIRSYPCEVLAVGWLGLIAKTFGRGKTHLRAIAQSKSPPSSTTRAALLNIQLP